MKQTNLKMIVLVACVIALFANYIFAEDWPQWRGSNRDAKVSDFKAPATWPEKLNQKWSVSVGRGDSTPALVGDKLYIFTREGDQEIIRCLNAETGEVLWSDTYEAVAPTGGASRHPGPRSTPTVADGKVITLGVGGILSCYNAANGDKIWRNDDFPGAWPQFFAAMSPIVVDGLCIAHLGKEGQGAIIACDLALGEEKWRWSGDGPTYSSPVLMTVDGMKQLVVHTEKNLVGIAVTDGKLLWKIETPNERRFYSSATAIVDGQTVIYTGQGTGTRAVKIKKDGDNFVAEELWANSEVGTNFNTPILKDGMLYGISTDSKLYCMSAENGKITWTGSEEIDRFGSILDAGSCLLALSPKSELIVIEPSSTEYKELARYKVSDNPIYAYPVVTGNRIYIKDQMDSIALWMVE